MNLLYICCEEKICCSISQFNCIYYFNKSVGLLVWPFIYVEFNRTMVFSLLLFHSDNMKNRDKTEIRHKLTYLRFNLLRNN